MGSPESRRASMARSCEQGYESSGAVKGGEYLG